MAATGDVIVSSDHLLRSGGDAVDVEFDPLFRVFEVVVEPGKIRRGIRRVPQKELKLSLRLLTEPDRLSFRGLYDGSGCWCDGTQVLLLAGVQFC